MRIVDLTISLGGEGAQFHPPHHPDLEVETFGPKFLRLSRISLSIHTGTHIECPLHILPEKSSVSDIPLERFVGEGVKLDLSNGLDSADAISASDLKAALPKNVSLEGKICLIHTGWYAREPRMPSFLYNGPYLAEEAGHWLVARRIKALGVDFEIDHQEANLSLDHFRVHRVLFEAGVPLLEFLTGLGELPATGFQVVALPLALPGTEGSPTRAVALLP